MGDGLIQRAARALAGLHHATADGTPVAAEDVARAVLGAIREPTDEMLQAPGESGALWACDPEQVVAVVWGAMIDAALAANAAPSRPAPTANSAE